MVPTGFADIDQLIDGGIRTGQVTAICGTASSGVTSLTYSIMAQAQQQNRNVLNFDLGQTFDAYSAMQWGVVPEQFFAVQTDEVLPSMSAVRDIVKNGAKLLIVLDTTDMQRSFYFLQCLEPLVAQLKPELAKSQSAILVLLSKVPSQRIQASYDTVLKLEHRAWIESDDDIHGYRVQATLLKHRNINGEPSVCIDILLKEALL